MKKLIHFLFYIDGVGIIDVKWSKDSPVINITTYVPDGRWGANFPEAYGHFTFASGNNDRYRFIGHQKFVNTHKCADKSSSEVNPYTSTYTYDDLYRPVKGETFRVWISVYWYCYYSDLGGDVRCCHRDMVYTNTVKY